MEDSPWNISDFFFFQRAHSSVEYFPELWDSPEEIIDFGAILRSRISKFFWVIQVSLAAETSSSYSKVAYLSKDTFVTKVVWQSHSPKEC